MAGCYLDTSTIYLVALVFDEVCKRSLAFVDTSLHHKNGIVKSFT